jgi:4-amino-4-deoxy-L-arabinose transferase-like glycosyltransferase
VQIQPLISPPRPCHPCWENQRLALVLWVLAGVLLIGTISQNPLSRTQEARVLETAREMLGQGWRDWLIPHCNGRPRLQKPPLAYWLAAGSFQLFGISEWAGRLPMALAGWATLGLTYLLGRRIINARAGLIAAAMLLSCFLFYRYARLAETDVLAGLFVTAAVYAIWRAQENETSPAPTTPLWHHLSAASIALAALAKGPPAAFPVIFLIGLAVLNRRAKPLWDWLKCGAPLTLALLAAPWFIFVFRNVGAAVLKREFGVILAGAGHKEPPWHYLPIILKVTAPWVGFVILAIIAAATHWRRDLRLRALLLWAAAIFLPLCLVGQKQEHYLMPLLPPLMILAGWMIDRALSGIDPPLTRAVTWIAGGTAIAGLAASAALLIAAKLLLQSISAAEVLLAAAIAAMMIGLFLIHARKGLAPTLAAMLAAGALTITLVLGFWAIRLQPTTYANVARQIQQRFAPGPYAFFGKSENLSLTFAMRQVIPILPTQPDLDQALASRPGLVAIVEGKEKNIPEPPAGMAERARLGVDEKIILIYRGETAP